MCWMPSFESKAINIQPAHCAIWVCLSRLLTYYNVNEKVLRKKEWNENHTG